MPTVFVYEFCCALGRGAVPESLYREGRAMRDAVADDFRRVPGVKVSSLDDVGPEREEAAFAAAVRAADVSLVVAPETGRVLEQRLGWVERCGGRHLGATTDAVSLCADKLRTAARWREHALPTPSTWAFGEWDRQRFPVVVKPRDGAGSEDTTLVRDPNDVRGLTGRDNLLVQDFAPGRAASVAFLIGSGQTVPLLPTFQLLSADGRFRYEGGELPIRPDLAERAVALGRRAVGCVPGLLGYVGVDLILGDAADGSADVAIEINPRLTTSYVGLRRLADTNLAETMLRLAAGEAVPPPRWHTGRVRFRPDGNAAYEPDTPWFGPRQNPGN